jgi:hypothetical protein
VSIGAVVRDLDDFIVFGATKHMLVAPVDTAQLQICLSAWFEGVTFVSDGRRLEINRGNGREG